VVLVIQILISTSAFVIGIIHLLYPQIAIDGIIVTLFAIVIIPWLSPLFKSLELPGGLKVEFQELLNAKINVEKAGLLASGAEIDKEQKYFFQSIMREDINLGLAGLRIEIEKRLKDIANNNNIAPHHQKGIRTLIWILAGNGILSGEMSAALLDLVALLNNAVHGADVDERAVGWALDIGPRILKGLDDLKIGQERNIRKTIQH